VASLLAGIKGFTTLGDMYGWNEPQRLKIETNAVGPGALETKDVNRKIETLVKLLGPVAEE